MIRKNEVWKLAGFYLICYFSASLIIFSIQKQGSSVVIALIGIVMICPLLIFNWLRKEPEPNIETLY
ncbi:hypothetical protein K9M79_06350 [Candidatus Woesearchaeota archaeon]|nr:hypothetical protein [Candidatus Woesearchaeota archaeon]